MHILLGILVMGGGIALIAYSASLTDAFGRRDWADRHLGGTTQGYILLGVFIIIVAIFVMTGTGTQPATEVMQGIPQN